MCRMSCTHLHMDTNILCVHDTYIFVYMDTCVCMTHVRVHTCTCSSVDSGKGEDLSSSCESAVFESQVEGQVSETISRLVN